MISIIKWAPCFAYCMFPTMYFIIGSPLWVFYHVVGLIVFSLGRSHLNFQSWVAPTMIFHLVVSYDYMLGARITEILSLS